MRILRMPFFQLGAWGPIKRIVEIVAPAGLLLMVASRSLATKESWVAHALEDVLTVSVPSAIDTGVACAAISLPTISAQVINKLPSAKPLSHSRSEIKLLKTPPIHSGSPG